jgi:hypothetical protein
MVSHFFIGISHISIWNMMMRALIFILLLTLLTACAAYSGNNLKPGQAKLEDVLRTMGQPEMRWRNTDGSQQLAYPRGPLGVQTYMVHIGADGVMQNIENVLNAKNFSTIQAGMTKQQVLKTLGPPAPYSTRYFKARDELAWEWRYCDAWNATARFNVLFDASKELVRSTFSRTESCGRPTCTCGH